MRWLVASPHSGLVRVHLVAGSKPQRRVRVVAGSRPQRRSARARGGSFACSLRFGAGHRHLSVEPGRGLGWFIFLSSAWFGCTGCANTMVTRVGGVCAHHWWNGRWHFGARGRSPNSVGGRVGRQEAQVAVGVRVRLWRRGKRGSGAEAAMALAQRQVKIWCRGMRGSGAEPGEDVVPRPARPWCGGRSQLRFWHRGRSRFGAEAGEAMVKRQVWPWCRGRAGRSTQFPRCLLMRAWQSQWDVRTRVWLLGAGDALAQGHWYRGRLRSGAGAIGAMMQGQVTHWCRGGQVTP